MKTLILLLAVLLAAAQGADKNGKISKTLENAEITLQSGRTEDEPRLLLELTSDTWVLGHGPCTIDINHSTLPCEVTRSTETISPRHTRRVTEYVTVSGGDKLRNALEGESVSMKVGPYEIELTGDDLKQLRAAVAAP